MDADKNFVTTSEIILEIIHVTVFGGVPGQETFQEDNHVPSEIIVQGHLTAQHHETDIRQNHRTVHEPHQGTDGATAEEGMYPSETKNDNLPTIHYTCIFPSQEQKF